MPKSLCLVFPNQLFEDSPLIRTGEDIILIEEYLFFKQYRFHKMKLAHHRAGMKFYADYLQKKGLHVRYIESGSTNSDLRELIPELAAAGIERIRYIDPVDDWLEQRILKTAGKHNIRLAKSESPQFINTTHELGDFFKPDKKKFFQTEFYKKQRIRLAVLLEKDQKPTGGRWTYDDENRKKYPARKQPPEIIFPDENSYAKEASEYINNNFPGNHGTISGTVRYPVTFSDAEQWLDLFLEQRFKEFGPYEDAIVKEEVFLNHSVLSPMLNTGLLTPWVVINNAIKFAKKNNIPLNSTEGFVRQILGWREFIRGMYHFRGGRERTTNFWKFTRSIPSSFYNGTTGIVPVDDAIHKALKNAYCHHIERLMILGNFMLLCEFDPDEVYRWFMELFIDAYDWVMVPNVYGMSQFADGGLMATKPYISGSNYILKMSNYRKGPWQEIWDALFWRFMSVHRDFFTRNPRLGLLIKTFDKMPSGKREGYLKTAERYLASLGS